MIMVCQPKVLETLLSVLVHVVASLQKHTLFLRPILQQTTKTCQNKCDSLILKGDMPRVHDEIGACSLSIK